MHTLGDNRFMNRELSWLSFNERVLNEAADNKVPILQRMRFLGIFSNNLDEFFRVRVASMRRLVALGKSPRDFPDQNPEETLKNIQKRVLSLQEKFQIIYTQLTNELKTEGIDIIDSKDITQDDGIHINQYFTNSISPYIVPLILTTRTPFPYLRDKTIYLAVKLISKSKKTKIKIRYALIEIPVNQQISRFYVIPNSTNDRIRIIILDDLIRYCLDEIFFMFEYDEIKAYTIKITRDAELDIDDDISKSLVEKMSKGLLKRESGLPVRFVYDKEMDLDLLKFLASKMGISERDPLIPGGKYHNFKDYINFPSVKPSLENINPPTLIHRQIDRHHSIIDVVKKHEILLHFPYQTFDHYIDFLREAAIDPRVKSIKITLYRVAENSKVINALVNAAKNGKHVTAVIELLARFDEEANINWSTVLQDAGVRIIHGVPGLKVHSKMTLITRIENKKERFYTYIGTGNFNEDTATLYCDEGLLTADQEIGNEVMKVFEFMGRNYKRFNYSHLVVAPYGMRKHFVKMIATEIKNKNLGKPAYIYIKLNSLVDETLIKHLYMAAKAGVKIKLIIRGICTLQPDLPELNGNIEAISIIDKYLEHSRFLIFANGGDEAFYITSADWMIRNLDHRVEIACPIYNNELKKELREIFAIQWADNVKARVLDSQLSNKYRTTDNKETVRAQTSIYRFLEQMNHEIPNTQKDD
ncbi:MAG: polyphosphate kinase 1 [Salinivirgaceae bacterium]|nr:polyphosphate kinase 1 [Salinivirgaceae bacterium]